MYSQLTIFTIQCDPNTSFVCKKGKTKKCQTLVHVLNHFLDSVPSTGLKPSSRLINTHSHLRNTNGGQHICYVNMCSRAPTSLQAQQRLDPSLENALYRHPTTAFDILLFALTDHRLENNGWDSAAVECSSFWHKGLAKK